MYLYTDMCYSDLFQRDPDLSNLGNVCVLNSIVQLRVHCSTPGALVGVGGSDVMD